jgi:hypothetical protein
LAHRGSDDVEQGYDWLVESLDGGRPSHPAVDTHTPPSASQRMMSRAVLGSPAIVSRNVTPLPSVRMSGSGPGRMSSVLLRVAISRARVAKL